MEKTGPIIIIDDDIEDLEIFKQVLLSLNVKNEIVLFQFAEEALVYLELSIDPCFFILCDVNMPKMNGLELRSQLNKDNILRLKTIPFLFLSTSSHMNHIFDAYNSSIQGYFQKPTGFNEIQLMFTAIILYWSTSLQPTPNYFLGNLYPKSTT